MSDRDDKSGTEANEEQRGKLVCRSSTQKFNFDECVSACFRTQALNIAEKSTRFIHDSFEAHTQKKWSLSTVNTNWRSITVGGLMNVTSNNWIDWKKVRGKTVFFFLFARVFHQFLSKLDRWFTWSPKRIIRSSRTDARSWFATANQF